jgi:uncharacterized membrane protein
MSVAQRFSHLLLAGSHLLLIALLVAWFSWLHPPANPGLIAPALLAFVTPLLIPLRGLLRGRRYTCAWTSLLAVFYFAHGVAAAGVPGMARILGVSEILLSLGLFLGCLLYLRATRPNRHAETAADH